MSNMMSENTRGVIFDIDGVLEYQGKAYPGAVELIELLRERNVPFCFVTNSTLKSRASCARRLRMHGFMIRDEEVFTASYLTAEYLRRVRARSCWVMVDGDGMDEFSEFAEDRENPEYIVIGDLQSGFHFEPLNRALRLLLQGAKLIGMQAELLDTSRGLAELNVGSWVGMLERASGVQATYIGKPSAFAFEVPLETMKLAKHQVTVVGDQLSTDIAGAQRLGMRTILVRTGEFRAMDQAENTHPDFAVDSVEQIMELISGT
jgi:HAD superfamily hydrolase (TIGR01458 family)